MRTFEKEYKIMAVNHVKEGEKPAAEVARELDLKPHHAGPYRRWLVGGDTGAVGDGEADGSGVEGDPFTAWDERQEAE